MELYNRQAAVLLILRLTGRATGVVNEGPGGGFWLKEGMVMHLDSVDPLREDISGDLAVHGWIEGVGPVAIDFDDWRRRFMLAGGSGDLFNGDDNGDDDYDPESVG